mgnify:CR=1 FL=1
MRFLSLHSHMEGFSFQGENLKWETPNLELNSNGKFSLSSIILQFESPPDPKNPIVISTSLMETDSYNTDGAILALSARRLTFFASTFEWWNLDSSRPRNVIFALRGVNVSNISYVRIVLAFE